jgi:hypothetical protein
MPYLGKRQMRRIRIVKIFLCRKKIFTCSDAAFCLLLLRHTSRMMLSRLFRAVSLVSSVALVAPLLSSNAALAATATTTSVTAAPSPAVAGQSVTLTATTSVPGTVNFTVDGQTVGTGISSPATSNLSHAQLWEWGPGNSIAYASDVDANGNIVTSGWNPGDCSGDRCKSKWITPAGGVTAFAGSDLTAYGIAIA